jgi:hypothetical protein
LSQNDKKTRCLENPEKGKGSGLFVLISTYVQLCRAWVRCLAQARAQKANAALALANHTYQQCNKM